jgi:hypothetical protein
MLAAGLGWTMASSALAAEPVKVTIAGARRAAPISAGSR